MLLCLLLAVAPSTARGTTLQSACSVPNVRDVAQCQIGDGAEILDAIAAPGESHRFRFVTTATRTRVRVDLTELSSDLDLYLTDDFGDQRGKSVQEGLVPESIGLTVEAGAYLIQIAADPGRPLVSDVASYRAVVSLQVLDAPVPTATPLPTPRPLPPTPVPAPKPAAPQVWRNCPSVDGVVTGAC